MGGWKSSAYGKGKLDLLYKLTGIKFTQANSHEGIVVSKNKCVHYHLKLNEPPSVIDKPLHWSGVCPEDAPNKKYENLLKEINAA